MNLEALRGRTLLIVDDEPALRDPLITEFESLGCRVFEAGNGKQAFEIVQREKIDAVISDIRMPGGDGVELLKNIKTLNHDCPVVMLITGFSDLSREEAYDLGAEIILAKPFDLDAIDEAVSTILTPRAERWAKPIDLSRIQHAIEREFEDILKAQHDGALRIGRGGFFMKMSGDQPFPGAPIRIRIRFAGGDILSIEGTGVVRWVRPEETLETPPGVGVEFDTLTSETRGYILAFAEAFKLKPYIPRA